MARFRLARTRSSARRRRTATSRSISAKISALAPTSMPRVGPSNINSRHRRRAIRRSRPSADCHPRGTQPSDAHSASRCAAWRSNRPRRAGRGAAQTDRPETACPAPRRTRFSPTERINARPSVFRFSGMSATPSRAASSGPPFFSRPSSMIFPAVCPGWRRKSHALLRFARLQVLHRGPRSRLRAPRGRYRQFRLPPKSSFTSSKLLSGRGCEGPADRSCPTDPTDHHPQRSSSGCGAARIDFADAAAVA